jgi:subtilisin-like proprotein convertase family protein
MKPTYLNLSLLLLLFLLVPVHLFAQNNQQLWSKTTKEQSEIGKQVLRKTDPNNALFFKLNVDKLKSSLESASIKTNTISFPKADGSFEAFEVSETPILEPRFQAKHPEIRTYTGKSIDNPGSVIYFSITPQGVHGMTLSTKNETQFIDPYSTSTNSYVVYNKKELPQLDGFFNCLTPENYTEAKSSNSKAALNASDGKLRTFRLALASTVEYATFQINAAGKSGASDAEKKAAVLAAMVVTMNRVNGIFKRELSLQMQLIDNNAIIFLAENDGFTNNDADALIDESQTVIDAAIGSANYDIGHTFSTGGGGLAELESPCVTGVKAKGITGSSFPVGDAYDVDFVAHEMGHQFGAPHTFNGNADNCGGGNRTADNAYEPGSGSTIMAYAGICAPQNVQSASDAYFHQKSLQMIWDNITSGFSTCANASAIVTGNTAPTAEAGASYNIPKSTPYKLTGSSTDADGTGTHTYTWEQYDLTSTSGLPLENNVDGPLVRSFEGTSNPTRYIPKLADLLITIGSTTWEKLPSVSRTLNFKLTVRDNDSRGGQTATDAMSITVDGSKGPFVVTSQNTTGISWPVGSTQTITWDVAGTASSPINTANVNILLSTDGGLTYPNTLASGVPNNGSYTLTVPNIPAPQCRLMVEAANNIYFALNQKDFSIGTFTTTCTPYTSVSNLNLNIPDGPAGATLTNIINIPDSKIINHIKVGVNITHSYIQDLTIRLRHPNGTTFTTLWDENCFDENNINVVFKDGEPSIVCASPTSGTYSPAFPLNVFSGLNASGNWTLEVKDGENGDVGILNNWYVEVCETTLGTTTYEAFSNLKVYPNPNNGKFMVALSDASNNDITLELVDIRGRSIYKKTHPNTGHFHQEIQLGHLQSGLYLLNISNSEKKSTKKIVVE